jgi:hypothetical protein
MLVTSSSARASYIFSEIRLHETANLDRVILTVGSPDGSSADIRAVTIMATPRQSGATFTFSQALLDGDSEPDIDFEGRAPGFKSYVRVGAAATWTSTVPTGTAKPWSDTNGDGSYTPGADPNGTGQVDRLIAPTQDPAWTAAHTFTAGGFNSVPVPTPPFPDNAGRIGEFVVPAGTEFHYTGTISGSLPGSEQAFDFIDYQPEPSTIGMLGVAALLLPRRRRRRH